MQLSWVACTLGQHVTITCKQHLTARATGWDMSNNGQVLMTTLCGLFMLQHVSTGSRVAGNSPYLWATMITVLHVCSRMPRGSMQPAMMSAMMK